MSGHPTNEGLIVTCRLALGAGREPHSWTAPVSCNQYKHGVTGLQTSAVEYKLGCS